MKKNFLFLTLLCVLLASCSNFNFDVPDCKVTVKQVENGKISVDKETCKIGDKITVTIEPNEGYMFEKFEDLSKTLYEEKFSTDAILYECVADRKNLVLSPHFSRASKSRIDYETNGHGTVTGPEYGYEHSFVEFTVTPDENYFVTQEDIKVHDLFNDFELYPVENTTDKYKFKMDSYGINISVIFHSKLYFDVELEADETVKTVKQGEKVQLNVKNISGVNNWNVYADDVLFAANADLSSGVFEVDTSKLPTGTTAFYVKDDTGFISDKLKIKVLPVDLPDGWRFVSIKAVVNDNDINDYNHIQKSISLTSDIRLTYYQTVKYYDEQNPTEIKTFANSLSFNKEMANYKVEYTYDVEKTYVFWIETQSQQIISNTWKVKIPCYTNFVSGNGSDYNCYYNVIGLNDMDISAEGFVQAEEDKDYYSVEVDETNGRYILKAKKPTGIPRKFLMKDINGINRSYVLFTIDASGSFNIKDFQSKIFISASSGYTSMSSNLICQTYENKKYVEMAIVQKENNYYENFSGDEVVFKAQGPNETEPHQEIKNISQTSLHTNFKYTIPETAVVGEIWTCWVEYDGLVSEKATFEIMED